MGLPWVTESSAEKRIARASGSASTAATLLAAALLLLSQAQAAESMTPGSYEVTTETVMLHLEEALRYATTRETLCLGERDLRSAFPVLRHDSLKGCTLDHESRHDDAVSYLMACEGGNGTSGSARWQLGEKQLVGRLDVKLGGKNMTFYQRITATLLGECAAPAK